MASNKNSNVNDPKTTCKALLALKVPMNIPKVNNPHMNRYADISIALGASPIPNFGAISMNTKVSQNAPYDVNAVVPKVLPFSIP